MRNVFITGSSAGLGKEIAIAFAKNNDRVFIHGRNFDRLLDVKQIIDDLSCYTSVITEGDITNFETLSKITDIVSGFGIDIFINNVGAYLKESITSISPEDIKKVIDTNLVYPIILTKKVFELFKLRKHGTIININSIAGKIPTEFESVYCATKFGMRGFSNSLKYEATAYGISIIDIYIGAMSTDMTLEREDRDKLINPTEAADIILSVSKEYSRSRISEIDILRNKY